jgi:rubrerythrin
MSQPETVDALLEAFFQERQPRGSLAALAEQAEAAGKHQLAKIFRAVIASDGYREKLMRHGLPDHARGTEDFYVCPHCGLIYEPEPPERCVVDETPAAQFEHIP